MMAYALEHRFSFALSSLHANFSRQKGWTDYFLPFCPEDNSEVHLHCNRRPNRVHRPFPAKWLYKLGIVRTYPFDRPLNNFFKKYGSRKELLMQDLFRKARKQPVNRCYKIPEMGWEGNLREICRKLVAITWHYNPATAKAVQDWIDSINLPEEYLGLHVRRGDKAIEYAHQGVEQYIGKLKKYSDCKSVFISTDDYSVVEELREKYPDYTFYTLCRPDERGYVQKEFDKLSVQEKENAQYNLWACIEILANAGHFVGTYSSNLGMFLGMRMSPDRCHGIDFDEWLVW